MQNKTRPKGGTMKSFDLIMIFVGCGIIIGGFVGLVQSDFIQLHTSKGVNLGINATSQDCYNFVYEKMGGVSNYQTRRLDDGNLYCSSMGRP